MKNNKFWFDFDDLLLIVLGIICIWILLLIANYRLGEQSKKRLEPGDIPQTYILEEEYDKTRY